MDDVGGAGFTGGAPCSAEPMRTAHGWVVSMSTSLVEDLAWSLVELAGDEGLAHVTVRSLARHTRVSPGTISNHFASKRELFAICTSLIGRWLAQATSDHIDDRGAVGLFPTTDAGDRTYRLLSSAWVQLRAYALADPMMDERVQGVAPMIQRSAGGACVGDDSELTLGAWMCVQELRHELARRTTTLTADEALELLQQVEPSARRTPLAYDD